MEHCANGWMDLEQEMIDSVDSFADRIKYTEGLILDEADQILEMADRIVYTEELMIDVLDSCSCRTNAAEGALADEQPSGTDFNRTIPTTPTESKAAALSEIMNRRRYIQQRREEMIKTDRGEGEAGKAFDTEEKVKSMSVPEPESESESELHSSVNVGREDFAAETASPMTRGVSEAEEGAFDHCSAMDMAIEVMDACLESFEVFNDDFLEVLSYMVRVTPRVILNLHMNAINITFATHCLLTIKLHEDYIFYHLLCSLPLL